LQSHADSDEGLRLFNAQSDSSLPSKQVTVCLRGRFTTNAGQL
jgi:hypothetical protein